MPLYTFECQSCLSSLDEERSVENRRISIPCECGSEKVRIVEQCTTHFFEPYYDEGLGVDVHSRMDRKVQMKELGLVETGDPVHGGRHYDSKAPNQVKKLPLRGVRRQTAANRDSVIKTHNDDGSVDTVQKFSELPVK